MSTKETGAFSFMKSKKALNCLGLIAFFLHLHCSIYPAERDDSIVKFAFARPDDAPIVSVVEVYPNRLVLREVGGRVRSARPPAEAIDEIELELANIERVGPLKTSEQVGRHRGDIWMTRNDKQVGFLIGDPPPVVIPLLVLIDRLFSQTFGQRYDFRLQLRQSSIISTGATCALTMPDQNGEHSGKDGSGGHRDGPVDVGFSFPGGS